MKFSSFGRDVAVLTAATVLLSIVAGWPELLFLGLVGAMALVGAVVTQARSAWHGTATVNVPSRLSPPAAQLVTATMTPRRTPLQVVVHINGEAHVAERVTVRDTGDQPVDLQWLLPPLDRGEHAVGPVVTRVVDPLEVLHRDRRVADTKRVIVHPRRHAVLPVPTTLTPEHDGQVSTRATSGGQAEDGVRPYENGDDLRLIHLPQSRRRGTVMVRRRVVAQASAAIVVLDTDAAPYLDDDAFEEAVSFAASLIAASATGDRPVEVHTTTGGVMHRGTGPAAVMPALDALARVQRHADSFGLRRLHRSTATAAGTYVVVTGVPDSLAMGAIAALARRRTVAAALAIGDDKPPVSATGRVISAVDASSAAVRWNRVAAGS